MRMNPMRNGQLKPGYNLQVASQNQYALYCRLFSNPTDTRTLIPFVTDIFTRTPQAAHWVVADAGYGSETNYQTLTNDFDLNYLIPHGMYQKELTRSYHQDRRKIINWQYNESDDTYTDLDGIKFTFSRYGTRHDHYGNKKQFKIYRAIDYFEDARRESLATTKSGKPRQISINNNWLYFKNLAKQNLQSSFGHNLYGQRKIEVEPIFANLKTHIELKRFLGRGFVETSNEVGLALMVNNLQKLSRYPNQLHIEE